MTMTIIEIPSSHIDNYNSYHSKDTWDSERSPEVEYALGIVKYIILNKVWNTK